MEATEVMACPAGVALLEALEVAQRDDVAWFASPPDSDRGAVARADASAETMPVGELLQRLVMASERVAGPWVSDAPERLASAFDLGSSRRSIAEVVARRMADVVDRTAAGGQEWWLTPTPALGLPRSFGRLDNVYCCGEFTFNGIWTVTSPPEEVHDDLLDVWEMYPGPISRWSVPIARTARVFEVNGPDDWARLVGSYPRPTPRHGGLELPGPNQHPGEIRALEALSNGAAARTGVRVFMPNWAEVADNWDGVRLSWPGMLTCEGRVIDVPELGTDAVSLVRYWRSERTLWLNDIFGTPTPMSAPALSGRINAEIGIDANLPDRRTLDMAAIAGWLGRNPFAGRRPGDQT